MSIKKHPTKGPGWWQIRISRGRKGKEEYYTFPGTEAEAAAMEAELRGIPQESKDQRLKDVLGRFLDWYTINRSENTLLASHFALRNILRIIGNKHISLLRQVDYDNYKAARLTEGVTKKTINNELSYLRSLLNYCRDELGLQPSTWPKLFTKKQTPPPSKTPLSPQEMAALIGELKGDKKTIVLLYSWGGLRRTEALQLQVKHVDLENNIISVTGKGNKTRLVSIVGDELRTGLEHALTEWPRTKGGRQLDKTAEARKKDPDEYLFICRRTGQPYKNIRKSIKAAAKRADITKDVWNHLLRHSFGTAAILAGVNLRSLQSILGHSDIRMTEQYTHMAEAIQGVEAQKLEALQLASMPSKPTPVGNVGKPNTEKAVVIQIDRNKGK